jgi:cell shape-determining protein MreC
MLPWVIQFTIISIILIFLVHHLINFFKSTLTVPKIKDLVNTPSQKYETMYNVIKNSSETTSNHRLSMKQEQHEYTLSELLPKKNGPTTMKNELKSFLKKQLNPGNKVGTDLETLDSIAGSTAYSNY